MKLTTPQKMLCGFAVGAIIAFVVVLLCANVLCWSIRIGAANCAAVPYWSGVRQAYAALTGGACKRVIAEHGPRQ
jgi:hypothetical protein